MRVWWIIFQFFSRFSRFSLLSIVDECDGQVRKTCQTSTEILISFFSHSIPLHFRHVVRKYTTSFDVLRFESKCANYLNEKFQHSENLKTSNVNFSNEHVVGWLQTFELWRAKLAKNVKSRGIRNLIIFNLNISCAWLLYYYLTYKYLCWLRTNSTRQSTRKRQGERTSEKQ